MATRADLIEFWRTLPSSEFVHPEDAPVLAAKRHRLMTDYMPGPWSGALMSARAFLLYLNPGFRPGQDETTYRNPTHDGLVRRALAGERIEAELIAHKMKHNASGMAWFNGRLLGVASYADLATSICLLNLVAYKSATFHDPRLIKLLPSSDLIRRVVRDEIAPLARVGKVMLIVVRQASGWGFSDETQTETLRVLGRPQARGGFLTSNTGHGQMLKAFLARS